MAIVEKIKEVTSDIQKNMEEAGVKEKAKSASMTALEVLGESVSELEKAINRGFKNIEEKYEENLKKVQAAKISPKEAAFLVEELEKLADLHQKGLLNEEEFVLAKARLLER